MTEPIQGLRGNWQRGRNARNGRIAKQKVEEGSEENSVVQLSLFAQLCLTFCDPMDCTVHGILQARILEWAAVPFSRGSSNPGIESRCPTLQVDSLPAEPQGKTRIPIVARILIGIHVSTAPSVTLFFLSKVFSQAESDFHDYCINSFCQFSDTSLPSRCD